MVWIEQTDGLINWKRTKGWDEETRKKDALIPTESVGLRKFSEEKWERDWVHPESLVFFFFVLRLC